MTDTLHKRDGLGRYSVSKVSFVPRIAFHTSSDSMSEPNDNFEPWLGQVSYRTKVDGVVAKGRCIKIDVSD